MEIRQFNNLLLRLIGGLLIYITLFKFTIGNLFGINGYIHDEIDIGIWGVLNVIAVCVFCFVFFINKPDFLTSLFYKRNYVIDLHEHNQYKLLKLVFLTFAIFALVRPILFYSAEHFWLMIKSVSFIMALFLIIAHKIITRYMVRKINSLSDSQSKKAFVFSLFSILLFFCIFNVYSNFYNGPFYLKDLFLNFTILFLCVCSPFIFSLLVKKEIGITNLHFSYILFLWLVFLHFLYGFLYRSPSYKGDSLYLIKDLMFNVLVPICLLCFHKFPTKIKPISSFRFLFLISGLLLVFCSFVKYLNNESTGIYFYLVSGLLFLYFSNKTGFLDKIVERINFKKIEPIENIVKSNNTSFIIICLLVLLFFSGIIAYGSILNLLVIIDIPQIIGFLLIGKLAVRKQMKLNTIGDFITLLIISISILMLTIDQGLSMLISLIFYHGYSGPVEPIYVVKVIIHVVVMFTAILFSSHIAKMINAVLPKCCNEKSTVL